MNMGGGMWSIKSWLIIRGSSHLHPLAVTPKADLRQLAGLFLHDEPIVKPLLHAAYDRGILPPTRQG